MVQAFVRLKFNIRIVVSIVMLSYLQWPISIYISVKFCTNQSLMSIGRFGVDCIVLFDSYLMASRLCSLLRGSLMYTRVVACRLNCLDRNWGKVGDVLSDLMASQMTVASFALVGGGWLGENLSAWA